MISPLYLLCITWKKLAINIYFIIKNIVLESLRIKYVYCYFVLFTFYLNSFVPPSFLTLNYSLTKSVIPVLQLETVSFLLSLAIPILSKVSKFCRFFFQFTINFLNVNHIFNCRSKHTLLPAVLIISSCKPYHSRF